MAITQQKIDTAKTTAPIEIEECNAKILDFENQIQALTDKRKIQLIKRKLLISKLEGINELEK